MARKHISLKYPLYALAAVACFTAGFTVDAYIQTAKADTPVCKKGTIHVNGVGSVEVTACRKGGKYYLSP